MKSCPFIQSLHKKAFLSNYHRSDAILEAVNSKEKASAIVNLTFQWRKTK